jgi:hypothetical protein
VDMADMSYLGDHYGQQVGTDEQVACVDVGPTADGQRTSRPAPDGVVEFEDLVILALQYGVGTAAPAVRAVPARAADGAVTRLEAIEVPALPGVGETFDVRVNASGGGTVQALRLALDYDRAVMRLEEVSAGELLGRQDARSVVLTPGPGRVDVALLGQGATLRGSGELARLRFRVKAVGDARLALSGAEARDGSNARVSIEVGTPSAGPPPTMTSFGPVTPNPTAGPTTLSFALATAGMIDLGIFGVDGRRVATLVHGERDPGTFQVAWDGRDGSGQQVRPGIYFARLITPHGRMHRTIVIMR